MSDPHTNLVSAIIRADKAANEMALSLARLKSAIKDAVEYEPPEPSQSEGGGVCQNCMGEGVDLIQSGRMVIKEICTSCNGTGRSEGGGDD